MGRRLLIIDDNASACEFLKDRLEAMGYTALVAHDGLTGLALMALETKQAPIEGVLLDLHMPIMDGIQVLHELRAYHETVPVVIMTGDPDQRLRDEAHSLGASYYFLKPIDPALFAHICKQTFPLTDKE
jgi:DNA-binding response OmpR family regulator